MDRQKLAAGTASASKGTDQIQLEALRCASVGIRNLLQMPATMDCTIVVHVTELAGDEHGQAPSAKRQRTTPPASSSSGGAAMASSSSSAPFFTSNTKTIKAHGTILCSKSDYFKAMLTGSKWAESEQKTIEVEVDCQEGKEFN